MLKENKLTKTYTDISDKGVKLKIGGDTDKFEPKLEIRKWEETSFFVKLKTDEVYKPVFKDDKVEADNIKLYKENDKYEFEITQYEKPDSNVTEFEISDDLRYLYQPMILTAHEIKNNAFRPEHIKGSYAIYRKDHPPNILGKKVYGKGKLGSIPRSKIFDSVGKWVWNELNIIGNTLFVTTPQDFIDTAVYPIYHAAGLTIGDEDEGGTGKGISADRIYAYYVGAPGASGDISKLTAWVFAGAVNYKALIIDAQGGAADASDDTIHTNGVGDATSDGQNWVKHQQDFLFSAPKPQFGASNYGLALICDVASFNLYYDVDVAEWMCWDDTNDYDNPVAYGDNTDQSQGYEISIFATYEEAAAGGNNNGFFAWM